MDWRIFFIGPMSGDSGVATQIPELRQRLVRYLIERRDYQPLPLDERRDLPWDPRSIVLRRGDDRLVLITPQEQELRSNITNNVFHQIDNADLVIADLTEHRPAVMYELAMAHSLGIDTILVRGRRAATVDEDDPGNFYLRQIRYSVVDFDQEGDLPETFQQDVDTWFRARQSAGRASNPLSDFYGAPLFDISAASGLASGFFQNFATPLMTRGEVHVRPPFIGAIPGLWKRRPGSGRPLKGLIVLRPERLTDDIPTVERRLGERLRRDFPDGVVHDADDRRIVVQVDRQVKPHFFVVDDYFIDVPRTLFSLRHSPRYSRVRRLQNQLSRNLENVLIERFFDNLRNFFDEPGPASQVIGKFHFGTQDEIPLIIKTGKSRSWTGERPEEWDQVEGG